MRHYLLIALCLCAASVSPANEVDPGQKIAQEAYDRDRGFGDFSADITMVISNGNQRRVRKLSTRTMETASGDKSISEFIYPVDVRYYARLTYAQQDGNDQQWWYIPEQRRVKRVSNAQQSSPFMGSDFAFEDLGAQRPEEPGSFTYHYIREEACGDAKQTGDAELNCWVIDRFPVFTYSGYKRQRIWIDQQHHRAWRIEYFNHADKHIKTLYYRHYQQYKKHFWRADEMFMLNHQTNSSTLVLWKNFKFGQGLNEADFVPANLKRVQ